MPIRIVNDKISHQELAEVARALFGDMAKAAVDIERGIMALGGELHADEEAMLLQDGSRPEDVWGVNIYPDRPREEWIEFDSMINIRPAQRNRSRNVENPEIRGKIVQIVNKLIVS